MDTADVLMEEKKLMAEAKYRNYMSNIDKALRNFEYSSEWADLISALGKLSKAISSNTQYQIIPRRIKISKRLAQCMHPALPSGVHLKALETYAVIFGKTGPERLATELFIYSSGLFPLLGYAAMNVRPALLGIYETYFVPLGEKLRPALSGFLSGVLPGYECGLDHFERTSSLLTQVCTAVNPTHFYTVLWECVATNASVRLPAISFLLEHFNKKMSMQEQIYVMGHNRDIMMSGLCACLNDNVILVQRNTLEFLLLGFPMHTKLLNESDLAKLVTNALNTILRRDMSLNRRLYSWLLGSEILKNSPTYEAEQPPLPGSVEGDQNVPILSYFEKHSRHVVIQAIITTLKFSLECTPVDLKPYRIMVSLLDKAEIGSAVLDYVLCDIIRTMSLSIGNVEVIKSSNLLFDTFDPAYIWSFMTTMFEKSCKKTKIPKNLTGEKNKKNFNRKNSIGIGDNNSATTGNTEQRFQCVVGCGDPSLVEICYLTEFLLETISLEMYNETTRIYLPKVFLAITQMLTVHQSNLSDDEIAASLKLCMKIVSRVQPMITSPIKLMPRNQTQNTKDEDNTNSTNYNSKPNPLTAAAIGANALEKSKSDSKLDQFANQENLNTNQTEENIRRSSSNQHMERKSPTKKKKAKSFSKLSELDKEICPDTGQLIDPRQSSSDLDTPMSIKKIKAKGKQTHHRLRMSPKKSRPQELELPEDKNASSATDSCLETPVGDYTDEEPKSAPMENMSSQKLREGFIFNYNEEDLTKENKDNYKATSSILEKCIRQYEIFFEIYLSHKVLNIQPNATNKCPITVQVQKQEEVPNVESIFKHEQVYEDINPCRLLDIDNIFETLKVQVTNRSKQLHSLLNRSLIDNAQQDNTDEGSDTEETSYDLDETTNKRLQSLLGLQLTSSLRQAVKLSVNLLVEMSTFPNCNKNITLEQSEKELPSWLKVLCTIACYSQNDKELQLAAVTTLFDLISLLKSQIEHTTSPGVTFVVMLPLLKFGHVHYIERRTRIFQLLTSSLWDCLGEHDIDNGQVCALLYQLQNCLESGLVESIIDNRMYSKTMQHHFTAAYDSIDGPRKPQPQQLHMGSAWSSYTLDRAADIHRMCVAPTRLINRSVIDRLGESESISFKKYELLWHLGRDKQQTRGFEKIQFKVLDTLALPPYMAVRTCVTKWLQSALLRGDLSRLVKPLYKILLSSNTKRVGIVHLHLLRKGSEELSSTKADRSSNRSENNNNSGDVDSSVEADVYAVSSEYGNIRYITDTASHNKKRSPIRSIQKKIFGVSLSSKNKTSNFVSEQTAANGASHVGSIEVVTTIGLIVNPLENSLDFDDEQEALEAVKSLKKIPLEEEEGGETGARDLDEEEDEDENDDPLFDQDYTDESDSSIYDSESEQRETSAEKDDSITTQSLECDSTLHLKRFVGHTESVTELLSQHERTKNRKTYYLNREKTPGENSLTSTTTTEDQGPLSLELDHEIGAGEVHPADEYFDSKSDERQVESFVEDLIGQVNEKSESVTTTKRKKKSKNHLKKLRSKKSPQPPRLLRGQEKLDKKRMSCISKISSDSNQSFTTGEIAKETEDQEDSGSSKFINIEEKRKTLNLETTKSLTKDWELTAETLEKSKQNLEILRQSASSHLLNKHDPQSSKRSSTKSCFSYDGSTRLSTRADKLVPLFQNHMLIYMNVYDTKQTLYAFHTLRNIISCDTRTFLCLSITTSLSSGTLKQLLTRHRKCIAGKGFMGSITTSEFAQSYRGCMHLEVLLLLCLFYARGFFHLESLDAASEPPTRADILGNCRVQLESIELLTLICSELIEIVKGMGKGLACYLADLMARCKLQKVILHCLNSSVNTYGHYYEGSSIAEQIINFNNPNDDNSHAEALQIQLLRLLMVVIKLEHEVIILKNDLSTTSTSTTANDVIDSGGSISPTRLNSGESQLSSVKYLPNCVISQQPMFLSAVLSALQDERLRALHHNWTELVTSSLNCFKFGSLTNIVISVVHQLCNNIDHLTKMSLREQKCLPPDYVISQLEAVTVLCHYCLLDNTQQTTLSQLFNQAYPQTSSIASQNSNTGQLFNSIVHSLLPIGPSGSSNLGQTDSQSPRNSQLMAARNAVLSHLPRIVSSVAAIWDSDLGQIRQIKQQLMEFLSPISLHHGSNFLAAIAVTWQERGEVNRKKSAQEIRNLSVPQQYQRNSMPQACAEQLSLVSLVSSIRVMPMDSFVQTLHQVVKTPPPIHRPPSNLKIEVCALELFYFYMKSAPAPQLGDSWTSLLALLRDGLSLTPPAQFTILMLLNEFVQRCPPFQDKKDIRDLHDVTSRLVDSLSNVAGSCLEQTTWLRRNLAVKEDIHQMVTDADNASGTSGGGTAVIQKYSVQAQSVLAAILANLLDVAYGSQEKDKVVSIITTLLYNITPYLKNHTTRNVPSFYACSSLLASLSGYQYTRKAWRKDMMDLLLDPSFFQMDLTCLPFWKQIMDSLMTYDNTTFRELMSRVSLTQTGSLNIFASREQEYEQRSMLLKRLAFVIFCSEFDQYHKYMPEIQEQLANSLRLLSNVPSVQAAVFLCFRVLLLRMSPDHVTSMWPIIIAEMVQVFLAMEQELKSDEDLSQHIRMISGMDTSWSSSAPNNGTTSHSQLYYWRSVQLEAAKILEMGCVLPATLLPHFQMYRWAFVGTEFDDSRSKIIPNGGLTSDDSLGLSNALYVPHIRRIARLMDLKYTVHSPTSNIKRGRHLMLTCQQINSLQDLYSFFSTLSVTCPNPQNYADVDHEINNCLKEIEEILSKDFLEKMTTSSSTPR